MVDVIIIKDADEETIKRILNGKKMEEKRLPDSENITKSTKKKKNDFIPYKGKPQWTKAEIKTLKTYFVKGNTDWELLKKLLPNRTIASISWRASTLGLSKRKISKKKRAELVSIISSEMNKEKKIEEKIEKTKGFVGSKNSIWTKKEDKIVKENYSASGKINWKTFRQLLPHRTKGSIQVRACHLKITNRNRKHSKHKKHKKIDGRTHRIVPRYQIEAGLKAIDKYHKFVKERSINYQKNGYNEPDSRRMAIADWHKQKHAQIPTQPSKEYKPTTEQKKAVVPENFPEFESISHDFQTLIEGITRHIIANKGTKLSYPNTKDILDISDGRIWHDFVAEFMTKSKEICEYFNVPNKFKHIREQEKYDVIIYEQ